ncbi:MAG: hypothetical protein AAGD86_01115 [Pseudomonadota bacterium]
MSKKRPAVADKQGAGAKAAEDDPNVNKIRDILFGGQMRDYDRRFAELDSRLAADVERLSKDLSARMDNLESYIARELATLTERLTQEKSERTADREASQEEIRELAKQSSQQLSALDEQSTTEARSIRAALLQQSNEMADTLREARDALAAETKKQSQSLEDRKVAREELAAMLSEVALRLNGEFDLPDGG